MTEYGMADPRWCYHPGDPEGWSGALALARAHAEWVSREVGFDPDRVSYHDMIAVPGVARRVGWYIDTEPRDD